MCVWVRAGEAFGAVRVCVDCVRGRKVSVMCSNMLMHVSGWHGHLQGVGFMLMARCRSGSDDMLGDAGRESELRKGRNQGIPLRGARAAAAAEMVGGQASWC